ncbi:Nucleotide-binding universal stress protein, UspA family [Rhizobium sp. RU35A]|uniref:Universal stress protein n=1 Tax=Rhizobium straminoryzae TaxID=1387186 RepID=A0A549T316_9HYPH|nr:MULTISPECIES: universal stress protein [Rhizobium]TRL36265.1 universal stress protein [Rhizobium straminoryzae]SIP95114.1 Nucleotide-binding universal stress protein, UspA family [Rhizobium sp. RU35A]
MYRSIVVAVDMAQLERGERILEKAATLLDAGGKITIVNVVEELPGYLAIDVPTDLVAQARTDASQKLAALRDRFGIDAAIEIRQGGPAHEILAAAEANRADLIVLASHVPDFSNYFIGATADRVVRHAKCSVLVDR